MANEIILTAEILEKNGLFLRDFRRYTWLSFETIRKVFLPRCLEDVVEDDDDEVVLALVASNPNFAAAAAITA